MVASTLNYHVRAWTEPNTRLFCAAFLFSPPLRRLQLQPTTPSKQSKARHGQIPKISLRSNQKAHTSLFKLVNGKQRKQGPSEGPEEVLSIDTESIGVCVESASGAVLYVCVACCKVSCVADPATGPDLEEVGKRVYTNLASNTDPFAQLFPFCYSTTASLHNHLVLPSSPTQRLVTAERLGLSSGQRLLQLPGTLQRPDTRR